VLFFTAATVETQQEWLTALEELLATKKQKVDEKSLKEGYLYITKKKLKRYCVLREHSIQYLRRRSDSTCEMYVALPATAVISSVHDEAGLHPTIATMGTPLRKKMEQTNKQTTRNERYYPNYPALYPHLSLLSS
jgi:hypothetical protein